METDKSELSRKDFEELVRLNVLVPSIIKTFDDAQKLAEDYLNPYIERDYIEGFDTDFNDDREFELVIHFKDMSDLNFSIRGTA